MPKPSLNSNGRANEDEIAKFGLVGQLTPLKDEGLALNQSISGHGDSTLDSPKSNFKSFLGKSKSSNKSESEFVVLPPALSYTGSEVIPSNSPTTLGGDFQQSQIAAGAKASKQSSMSPTLTPGAVVDMLVTQMTTEKGQRAMELGTRNLNPTVESVAEEEEDTKTTKQISTITEVENETKDTLGKGGVEESASIGEDEDEVPIDLFPKRMARPY
jgi:hypothetical protein